MTKQVEAGYDKVLLEQGYKKIRNCISRGEEDWWNTYPADVYQKEDKVVCYWGQGYGKPITWWIREVDGEVAMKLKE